MKRLVRYRYKKSFLKSGELSNGIINPLTTIKGFIQLIDISPDIKHLLLKEIKQIEEKIKELEKSSGQVK